ncbi:hypothetical protein [Vibrio sp. THAF190c]|uniref:hypothetical protein n=1 Tax=Vibrio sp. THAF190c TaxID=2587865 RepID=UPI0012A8596F|nr:hypothetical protein [Vibrio sp. THAF190c]QFT13441.1 hypothetical protein FIV04_26160 [Vibrio sp. THAF190c]
MNNNWFEHLETTVKNRICGRFELPKFEGKKEYGRILSSMPYKKKALSDLVGDPDITDAPQACMACSR